MKVAVFQFNPEFGERENNLKKIRKNIKNTKAKLLVLPELCTTGYQFISRKETKELSESIPGSNTVKQFEEICAEADVYLIAGMAERDGEEFYNSSLFIGPKGYIGKYRKVHLFKEEKKWFSPGNIGFRVWDIEGARVGMMICFDWIFPEAARSLTLQGADIIGHPVNLVLPYCQRAMVTRALENGVFIITANRVGSEKRGGRERLTYTGQSQIVNPRGKVLFRLGRKKESFKEIDIDPRQARDKNITPENHILHDRRPDQYSID
ncbi:MAG: nitrilase-related carbon-nitrogen hydrolase [bacterium]